MKPADAEIRLKRMPIYTMFLNDGQNSMHNLGQIYMHFNINEIKGNATL